MQTEKILLAITVLATTALSRLRFVNFAGGTASATDTPMGIANANYDAGEQAGVNSHGELLVETGAAVTVGAQVQPDSQGRAIPLASGVAFGRARDPATGAGQFIRVLR